MPSLGSGDDQTVGRVAMHILNKRRSDRDLSIYGDLVHTLFQDVPAPGVHVEAEIELTFLNAHTDFPKGDGREREITLVEGSLERFPGSGPQPVVTKLMP